jgi:glycosyltransferase involved in cell wall biosynthesis
MNPCSSVLNHMREEKIAILIPVFNAGALLAESIASIAARNLPAHRYEIIVSDNDSSDGSIERLPPRDGQGALIHVRRNRTNLGRVENWNCALAAAQDMGFGYAFFLMAGDLADGDVLAELYQCVSGAGAVLGLASYEIVDENLKRRRLARRIHWRAKSALSAQRFLAQSFAIGGMLLAPLGANLYDLRGPSLRFDPGDPTHTDQAATASFLLSSNRPVIYLDRPLMRWRRRAERFHSSMNLKQRLAKDRALAGAMCRDANVALDEYAINCTFLLRIIFHARGNIIAAWRDLQSLFRNHQHIRWSFLIAMVWRQLIYKTPWRVSE